MAHDPGPGSPHWDRQALEQARAEVVLDDPELMARVVEGGSFGGRWSRAAAGHMFSPTHRRAIEEVRAGTEVQELAPRTWLVRLPIVNSVVFETSDGLVVVDTGMAPAGPALVEAIRSVSQAPVHTVVYTHGHVDHCYGTWALLEAGERPEIVATEGCVDRLRSYIRLRGSLARYMNQPVDELPASDYDVAWPTHTFRDDLDLDIGGERFALRWRPAETDDQCYVWAPDRRVLACADYYQGFLPNLGNGKRRQRDAESWIYALREMAGLAPTVLLPGHGEALSDPDTIVAELTILADALAHIVDHTVDALNQGLRQDLVAETLTWPEPFASHPTLREQYVSARDISRMVARRWTGWWDDVPSHWSPAPLADQARTVVELAGGIGPLAARARSLAATDLPLACHLADWAWYADSGDPEAQQLVLEVYRRRILDPAANTQEILVYLDHMAAAHAAATSPG